MLAPSAASLTPLPSGSKSSIFQQETCTSRHTQVFLTISRILINQLVSSSRTITDVLSALQLNGLRHNDSQSQCPSYYLASGRTRRKLTIRSIYIKWTHPHHQRQATTIFLLMESTRTHALHRPASQCGIF